MSVDEMFEPPRAYLEFYRIDLSGPTRRILIPSGLLVTFGASMVCFSAAVHGTHLFKQVLGFLGATGMLVGLLSAIVGMYRLLQEDAYVAVVDSGLFIRAAGIESFCAWIEIKAIACDGRTLTFDLDGKPPLRLENLLAATKARELATRLEEWRRKAAWNLAPERSG